MPYETVSFPHTDTTSSTEVSVHWTKNSYAQLKMERHVWGPQPEKSGAFRNVEDPPQLKVEDFPPLGTVKATGAQIAYKIAHAYESENCASSAEWVVVRIDGAVERCFDEQIVDWPVVFYPSDSGYVAEALVWSELLTRSEINRMIKVLRKARDDVFEADA